MNKEVKGPEIRVKKMSMRPEEEKKMPSITKESEKEEEKK